MKKIKLTLDDLEVKSFEVLPVDADATGTVRGQLDTEPTDRWTCCGSCLTPQTCTMCPTCDESYCNSVCYTCPPCTWDPTSCC